MRTRPRNGASVRLGGKAVVRWPFVLVGSAWAACPSLRNRKWTGPLHFREPPDSAADGDLPSPRAQTGSALGIDPDLWAVSKRALPECKVAGSLQTRPSVRLSTPELPPGEAGVDTSQTARGISPLRTGQADQPLDWSSTSSSASPSTFRLTESLVGATIAAREKRNQLAIDPVGRVQRRPGPDRLRREPGPARSISSKEAGLVPRGQDRPLQSLEPADIIAVTLRTGGRIPWKSFATCTTFPGSLQTPI